MGRVRIIQFSRLYVGPILAGHKTSTIRLRRQFINAKAGDRVQLRNGYVTPPFAFGTIIGIDDFELTAALKASREYLAEDTEEALAARLERLYPGDYPGGLILVRFRLVSDDPG